MESLIRKLKKVLAVEWLEKYDISGGPEVDEIVKSEYGNLLMLSGVYPSVRNNRWILSAIQLIVYFVTLFLFTLDFLIIATYAFTSDYNLAAQSLHFSMLIFLTMIELIYMIINRNKFNHMHLIIRNNYYKYDDGIEIEELESWNKELRNRKILVVVLMPTLVALVALSVLGVPLMNYYFEFKRIEIEGLDMRTPVPSWHPFSKDDEVVFYVIFVLAAWSTFLAGLVLCSSDIIFVFTNLSIVHQLKILRKSIVKLEARAQNIHKMRYPNIPISMGKMKTCYMHCIKQNVQHHFEIERVFGDLYEILFVPVGLGILLGSFVLAASLAAFVLGDGSPGVLTSSSFFLLAEVAHMSMLCYFGQQSSDIFFALYNTNWPTAPKEVTLSIRIMVEKSKSPLEAKAFGLWPLNHELFLSIINTAYSYLNVLLGVKARIKTRRSFV